MNWADEDAPSAWLQTGIKVIYQGEVWEVIETDGTLADIRRKGLVLRDVGIWFLSRVHVCP